MNEDSRQLIHAAVGTLILVLAVIVGERAIVNILVFILVIGVCLIHLRMRGTKLLLVEKILSEFERKKDLRKMPGKGAFYFLVGTLFAFTFYHDFNYALAVIGVLSWGDSASTIVGRRFSKRGEKTWQGTLAFILFSLVPAVYFLGVSGVLLAVLLGLYEALPLHIDYYLGIPILGEVLRHLGVLKAFVG